MSQTGLTHLLGKLCGGAVGGDLRERDSRRGPTGQTISAHTHFPRRIPAPSTALGLIALISSSGIAEFSPQAFKLPLQA